MLAALALYACGPEPAAETPASAPVSALHALGTEPFWSADLGDGRLSLTRPDHPPVSGPATLVSSGGARFLWEAKATDGRTIRMRVAAGDCSDGMSDRRYPLKVEIDVGDEHLKGCASGA
jgi:uncharacterized membrane protein